MSTGEQVDEQLRPRRASERRSSLEQIEALKVRRASERRASVELSAELVDQILSEPQHCTTHDAILIKALRPLPPAHR